MSRTGGSVGLQTDRSGCSETCPSVLPDRSPERSGSSASRGADAEEQSSPVRSRGEQFHLPANECAGPRVREIPLPAQVATRSSAERRGPNAAITAVGEPAGPVHPRLRLQATMVRAESRLRSSRASLNSSCRQYQAKELIGDALTLRENIIDACQEYEELGGFATAKLGRKQQRLELAHPPHFAKPRRYWRFVLQLC